MTAPVCSLCTSDGGVVIARSDRLRVIRADEPGFPAFYRVVWRAHVAELSDLSAPDRAHCMDAVVLVERLLREHLQPTKVNLAALGNMVPHLHWHVIARFHWDTHFPAPVWAAPQREIVSACIDEIVAKRATLEASITTALGFAG